MWRKIMTGIVAGPPWYRSLTASQWKTLIAANLVWMFNGYETFALIITVAVALRELVDPSELGRLPSYIGTTIGITLLGWGIGGLLGGICADYFGRKRMMIYAILPYATMAGLSALAWDWTSFVVLRFLVGITVGSDWATGASMTAEAWPTHARGKAAGLMQCGLGIGFFLASFAWLFIGITGPDAWRWMYVLGIAPALAILWIGRGMDESKMWVRAQEQRRTSLDRQKSGAALTESDTAVARFTVVDLFVGRAMRRQTIIVFLMSLTTTLAWWGISTWVPQFIGSIAGEGRSEPQWASYAGMAYTTGSVVGYVAFGFLADAFGRKPITMLYMLLALVLTPVLFLATQDLKLLLWLAFANAIFSNGQYSWMPVWLPELYPTRIRATAMAFAFNAPRFIAFLGPVFAGTLIQYFGGFGYAATIISLVYLVGLSAAPFLPETRGKPLPE
jgi:MFS family permease